MKFSIRKLRNMKIQITIILCMSQVILAMQLDNCFDCANSNSGNNFICSSVGGELFPDQSDALLGACCSPNDDDVRCKPVDGSSICSTSYNQAGHSFYNYCPMINSTRCGMHKYGPLTDKDMIL